MTYQQTSSKAEIALNLEIDPDVKAVAEFMQSNVPAAKLAGVASAVQQLAPVLWGQHQPEEFRALCLAHPQPTSTCSET